MLRASLVADGERNARLIETLLSRGAADADAVAAALEAEPRILRTLPAFFNVQVVAACPQSCSYCPYPVVAGDPRGLDGLMPVEQFDTLLGPHREISRTTRTSASPCGASRPAPRPRGTGEDRRRRHPGISLVIETSGVGWRPGVLAGSPRRARRCPAAPTWIVSLDASSAGVYEGLRGQGFAEASATAAELMKLFPTRPTSRRCA